MSDIRVVIAYHEKMVRASYVKQLLSEKGIHVIAEAGTRQEVVEALRFRPKILVLDWKMLNVNEVSLLLVLRKYSPGTRVILLTGRIGSRRLVQAFSHGARGHTGRTHARSSLAKAVRLVDQGDAWISRSMGSALIAAWNRARRPAV